MSAWKDILDEIENMDENALPTDYLTYPMLKYSRLYPRINFYRDITPMVYEEIDYRIRNNSNFIERTCGIQGSGKSMISLALGTIYQKLVNEIIGHTPKFYYSFSLEETISIWLEMEEWDIIMEDEAPKLQGPNSYTIQKNYVNMLDQERARHKSLLINSPRYAYVSGISFCLETLGFSAKYNETKDPNDMITKARLYYPRYECGTTAKFPLGLIELCVGTPACLALHADYHKAKMVNIMKLEENQGSVGSDLKTRVNELVTKVKEAIARDYPTVKLSKNTLKPIIVQLGIPVSSTIMDLAINTILLEKSMKKNNY